MAAFFKQAFALFEDNLSTPGRLVLLSGLRQSIQANTPEELSAAFIEIEVAQSRGYWLALAGSYELGAALEASLRENLPETVPAPPLLQAWVYAERHEFEAQEIAEFWRAGLAELTPQEQEAGLLSLQPTWSAARHAHAAERVLAWIHAGDCYQVNLTFPLNGLAYGHPLALFARLRETQPVAYGVLMFDGHRWVLSRSPELFVARQGVQITCKPMKGTALRSKIPAEDETLAQSLQSSTKDRAENLMIVDLIRNDLGRITPAGGVRVERLFELESYQTIHQLTSSISASPVNAGLSEMLTALFPCGSVTGAPKVRAMQIIHTLEEGPRGLYCGALGWLAPNGDLCLNVPIRTLLLQENGHFRLDIGSGIVADSTPAAEYSECLSKANFARQLISDLSLIETLKWDGVSFPLLNGHLQRLCFSAQELGIPCDPISVSRSLLEFAATLPEEPRRIRLLMRHDGTSTTQAAVLNALASPQRARRANFTLNSADPRLRHKSSARAFYDAALHAAMAEDLFDVIFSNERGELCEGARSNIFLEMDDGPLHTPSLHCGLLPGVLRAHLLASGRAIEMTLENNALLRARRIFLGNALRGLIEVTIQA